MSRAKSSYLILLEGILSNPKNVNHLRPLKQFRRLETPFFVALMATASNLSKAGFHNKITHSNPRSFDCSEPRKTLRQPRFICPSAWSRPCHNIEVRQDEYLIWYLFYGTLADTDLLTRLLSLLEAEPPILMPASIPRGLIKWHGKYKALVDGVSTDYVHDLPDICELTIGPPCLRALTICPVCTIYPCPLSHLI